MRIRWTALPAAELQSISYLQRHHPQYRQPTLRKLYSRRRALIGRRVSRQAGADRRDAGAFVYADALVVVYSLRGGYIEIWRVYHTSQDRG